VTELLRYPFTATGLSDAQAALGTTAEAVKRNLTAMGFKGHRGECHTCPVAMYLLNVMEEIDKVDVSVGMVRIGRTIVDYTDVRPDELREPMTHAIDEFVEFFDAGVIPALDLEVSGA
jgi:NADH/NAD ratio-sensing transcriptional regulator Rex